MILSHERLVDYLPGAIDYALVSLLMILVIGAVATGIGVTIFFWNRKLEESVDLRTAELTQANEKLKIHGKLQKEFINVAAHELRTPIQPILGLTDIFQRQRKINGKLEISKDELDILARNAKRLERLSSDILEVSRLESGFLKLDLENLNLNQKIQDVIIDIESFIPDKSRLKIVFEPRTNGPVIVEADQSRLFEVLSNILTNAIKFTKEGIIRVVLEEKDGQAIVSIKDTGEGIDAEILPKLFEKFVTKSEQGTGLGLYLAKGIIKAHGGTIWAENNMDGKGATFAFALRVAKQSMVSNAIESS